MYVIPILLFIAGVSAGGVYGVMSDLGARDLVLALGVGGFAGSALGGILFTYLYFRAPEDLEPESGSIPPDRQLPLLKSLPATAVGPAAGTSASLTVPAAPPMSGKNRQETDRQKIRRLEKEIHRLKKQRVKRS
jgi:hypothetical protein